MRRRFLLPIMLIFLGTVAHAQEYFICTGPTGRPEGCAVCTSADGTMVTTPVWPECYRAPGRWEQTIKPAPGTTGPGGEPTTGVTLESTPGSAFTQFDYGVMARVASRLFVDGGYAAYTKQVTEKIQGLSFTLTRRIGQLQTKYKEIAAKVPQYLPTATAQLQKVGADAADHQTGATTAIRAATAELERVSAELAAEPSQYVSSERSVVANMSVAAGLPAAVSRLPQSTIPTNYSGLSLAGSVEPSGIAAYGQESDPLRLAIQHERLKVLELPDKSTSAFCSARLRLASRFAEVDTERSRIIAQHLLDESSGARFATGEPVQGTRVWEVRDGLIVPAPSGNAGQTNELGNYIQQFDVRYNAAESARERAESLSPPPERQEIAAFSLMAAARALHEASSNFFGGDFAHGETLLNVATGLIGLAIDFTPPLALARATVEMIAGYDIITGQPLTDMQKAFNGWTIATAGLERGPLRIIEGIKRGGALMKEEAASIRAAEGAATVYRSKATAPVLVEIIPGKTGMGYRTFPQLKKAMGSAGPGKEWHHIVEQGGTNVQRFGERAIHNQVNIIAVPKGLHKEITRRYNTGLGGGFGVLYRDAVHSASFEAQYDHGVEILKGLGIKVP